MIVRLTGTLLESNPLSVVIDAGGVGYEVHIPITTAEKIGGAGKNCTLFIQSVYREDSATLYGFYRREDRDFFRLIVEKVSGIGPKIAIGILSRMSVEVLQSAIASADVALLSKCPGIGKKTAERLVIELKDKMQVGTAQAAPNSGAGDLSSTISSATPSAFQDAVASLIILGYKPAESDKLVRKAIDKEGPEASVEILVKTALS